MSAMGSSDKTRAVKAALTLMAKYYHYEIDDMVLDMYAEDLADIPGDKLKEAFGKIRRDPSIRRMPLPAEIRALANPQLSETAHAVDIANRILQAAATTGCHDFTEANTFVGEIGQVVVARFGGWPVLMAATSDELNTLRAQLRESAKSIIEMKGKGITALPSIGKIDHAKSEGMKSIGEILRIGKGD